MEVSERHKEEIKREIGSLSDNTKQIFTTALFIGGALTLAYFAFNRVGTDKRKKRTSRKDEKNEDRVEGASTNSPSLFSQVGDVVIAQATLFLLDLAKEKLSEYLQQKRARHENI